MTRDSKIVTMDFRDFRTMDDRIAENYLSASIVELLRWLPNLRSIVCDGHTDHEPEVWSTLQASAEKRRLFGWLRLLSMANCRISLPPTLFTDLDFHSLFYLDISANDVQTQNLIDPLLFSSTRLPSLRILKLRSLGLDTSTVGRLLREFGWQLWSVDLSCNELDDSLMDILTRYSVRCEVVGRLQTSGRFQVEGQLKKADPLSGVYFIEESTFSATFSHADRYLADPPVYTAECVDHNNSLVSSRGHGRLTGTEAVQGDSLDDMIQTMDGGPHYPIPDTPVWRHNVPPGGGLMYLHLNDLRLTCKSVETLLSNNCGYLEHIECSMGLVIPGWVLRTFSKASWLPDSASSYGFPGASYLFRPVISSNLRVLNIHHSLVTNVPTLMDTGACVGENIWLAETCLRERMDLAFPQTYKPDMNPRLHSLTLSKIPRHSNGMVIKRLINFLKLAAAQEQDIEKTMGAVVHHRSPTILRGLRHICLEFEPERKDELLAVDSDTDVAEALEEFTFFSEGALDASSPPVTGRKSTTKSKASSKDPAAAASSSPAPPDYEATNPNPSIGDRLITYPFDTTVTEYQTLVADADRRAVLPVWIGSGVLHPENPPAVNEYMRLLAHRRGMYAQSPVPATPCHVAAGVPAGSFIYGAAWDKILVPPEGTLRRPTVAELRGLRDVLGEIKAFRLASRARFAALKTAGQAGEAGEHVYWKGKLDIVLAVED